MARVAIVTGGTRGIGRAICETLQAQGLTVVANYAGNEGKARAFSDETGIAAYKWDVGDHDASLAGCRQVEDEVGPIDVLVNNAGDHARRHLLKMSFEDWYDAYARSTSRRLLQHGQGLLPRHEDRGWGRIVNIGSINGQAASTARSTTLRPRAASTASPRRWREEGRASASPSTPSPRATSTPTWSPRSPRERARKDRRPHSGRPAAAKRWKSPAASLSWLPRTAASSPGRRCRSTARPAHG